jgi:hypothetical protein
VASLPGVQNVLVQGRWMGRSLVLDVEGCLPAETSLAEAETIGRAADKAVHTAVHEARDVRWIPRQAV